MINKTKLIASTLAGMITLCWNANVLSKDGVACGNKSLELDEIEECRINGKDCEVMEALKSPMQIRDFITPKLHARKDSSIFLGSKLVRFELDVSTTTHFSGKGFKNRSLFQIGNNEVVKTHPCVGDELLTLVPGTYILKSVYTIGSSSMNSEELNTTIEPILVQTTASVNKHRKKRNNEKLDRRGEFNRTMLWSAVWGCSILFFLGLFVY